MACASPGIGKGSRFVVRLPDARAASDADDVRDGAVPAAAAPGALRIMVVDDNVDAAEMLAMVLECSGHQVLVEHASRQALERARAETPDVCLLDIGLPDMDGNELARRLRIEPDTAGAVLIAVTGYGQESDRNNALAAGFDHYLVKPVDTAKLEALLAAVPAG